MPLYVTPSVLLDVETQATHDVTIILRVFNYFSSRVGMVNSCNYCNTHKFCQNSLWGRSQTEAPCLLNSSNADPEYQSALIELQIMFALLSEPWSLASWPLAFHDKFCAVSHSAQTANQLHLLTQKKKQVRVVAAWRFKAHLCFVARHVW